MVRLWGRWGVLLGAAACVAATQGGGVPEDWVGPVEDGTLLFSADIAPIGMYVWQGAVMARHTQLSRRIAQGMAQT